VGGSLFILKIGCFIFGHGYGMIQIGHNYTFRFPKKDLHIATKIAIPAFIVQ